MEAYQSLPMEFCVGISPEMIRYPSAEFVDGAIHRFCGMVWNKLASENKEDVWEL